MSSTGRYLYGIIRAEDGAGLALPGLDDGDQPTQVAMLPVGGLGVLLSPYPAERKVPPLRKNLLAHNRVIREVLDRTTILPLGLGQVAGSEDELVTALTPVLDELRGELRRLQGRVEMDLGLRIAAPNVFAYLVSQDEELRAARDQIFAPGRAPTQSEKLDLGRLFEERLAALRQEHEERVSAALRAVADDVAPQKVQGEAAVLKLAVLVRREALPALEAKVSEIAATYPADYAFDYRGPFAPFHFTAVDIRLAS